MERGKRGREIEQPRLARGVCKPPSLTVGRNCFDKGSVEGARGREGGREGERVGQQKNVRVPSSVIFCVLSFVFLRGMD